MADGAAPPPPTGAPVDPAPRVVAVAADGEHRIRKPTRTAIRLVAGLGVEGDAHAGVTVQHLSRIRRDPSEPNLRQVHLVHAELHDELRERGFEVGAGEMGENVTTRGIDLLGLARGTRLRLGGEAVVEVTGLRNPCTNLDRIADGLMAATLGRAEDGSLVRRAGVMAVVIAGGRVAAGDPIVIEPPAGDPEPLRPV